MKTLLLILAVVLGIAWAVITAICAIRVLVKLFRYEGMLKGIVGIFVGPYTFVWGWWNAKRLGLTKVMTLWSVMLSLAFLLVPTITMISYALVQPKRHSVIAASPNKRPSESSNQAIVLVDEKGELTLNEQGLGPSNDQSRTKLLLTLKQDLQSRSDRTVVVRISRKCPLTLGEIAKITVAVKEAGGDPVKVVPMD